MKHEKHTTLIFIILEQNNVNLAAAAPFSPFISTLLIPIEFRVALIQTKFETPEVNKSLKTAESEIHRFVVFVNVCFSQGSVLEFFRS